MSERRLWQRMKTGIEPFCFAQRIENLVGDGVPDVVLHCRRTGREGWVELKCRPTLPVRADTPIFKGDYGLRPDQIAWNYGRARAGANLWILGQGGNALWLVHGCFSRELDTFSRAMLDDKCAWRGMARATDWQGMLRVMLC